MNSRKQAARALTFFPAVVLLVAAVVQIRARAQLARAEAQPRAITYLVDRPAVRHPRPQGRVPRAEL